MHFGILILADLLQHYIYNFEIVRKQLCTRKHELFLLTFSPLSLPPSQGQSVYMALGHVTHS